MKAKKTKKGTEKADDPSFSLPKTRKKATKKEQKPKEEVKKSEGPKEDQSSLKSKPMIIGKR